MNERLGYRALERSSRLRSAFHSISAFIVLSLFWMLLSGYFTPFLLAAGVGSALAAVWFSHRMKVIDAEGHPIHLGWRALFYWPWLLKEVMKSAWQVSCLILHPRLPISPTVVRFRPGQRTDLGLVIHANSITLTPGTISMEVSPEGFVVHAITAEAAQAVTEGEMDRRVTRFEGS